MYQYVACVMPMNTYTNKAMRHRREDVPTTPDQDPHIEQRRFHLRVCSSTDEVAQ
jgi:hypothetical protein